MQDSILLEDKIDKYKIVRSKINKEYFEYYAKYSLITSLDKKYTYLHKDESPDWQSDILNIGIEVTRAIDKDIYLAYNLIDEYFGNVFMSNHIEEKIKERQQTYAELLDSANISAIDYDDISNIDNLRKRYIHKTTKLNKNYVHYNENLLYMFTFKSMDEEEVRQCFLMDLSQYKYNFDLCFINCFDRIYVCNFTKKEILDCINVDLKDLLKIKKKALRKSHLI